MWTHIISAPRTGVAVRCGWFAADPDVSPLEFKQVLVWRDGAWRQPGVRGGEEWSPTHWWKSTRN